MDRARTRSGRPRGAEGTALLDAARQVFLHHGFAGATMAAVAARARVSKSSLYRDYPSKDALFAAVVSDWVLRGRDAMRPHVDALASSDDVANALSRLAAILQRGILSEEVLGMRRIVAAEADRFPQVARDYLAESWDRNIEMLATALERLMDRGVMAPADARAAAALFTWMVVGEPLNARTLGVGPGDDESRHLDSLREAAVSAFAARYLS